MKYLFDARYKVINTTTVYLTTLVRICKAGQSEMLDQAVQKLSTVVQTFDALKSPPFDEEDIRLVTNLQERIHQILHLPEDIITLSENTLKEAKKLLGKIDPFTTHYEETAAIRKSQIVELLCEFKSFLKVTLPDVVKAGKAIVDQKSVVHKIVRDLHAIDYHDFPENEKAAVVIFLQTFETFKGAPTEANATTLSSKLVSCEAVLRGNTKAVVQKPANTLHFLYQVIRVAEKEMTLDQKQFPKFKEILKAPAVLQAVSDLSDLTLPSDELKEIKDTIIIAHKNMLLEDGANIVSRTRFIELFRIFGHEIIALKVSLESQNDSGE